MKVFKSDYFLSFAGDALRNEFIRAAKVAVVESFCKIHRYTRSSALLVWW